MTNIVYLFIFVFHFMRWYLLCYAVQARLKHQQSNDSSISASWAARTVDTDCYAYVMHGPEPFLHHHLDQRQQEATNFNMWLLQRMYQHFLHPLEESQLSISARGGNAKCETVAGITNSYLLIVSI